MDILTRLAERIDIDFETGCWNWTLKPQKSGYSQVRIDGRVYLAHRLVYATLVGDIPAGMDIDHICRNRGCVNPDHLEPVTRLENTKRGIKGDLTTHCPQGHPYDNKNTRFTPQGHRRCRECHRIAQNARYHRLGKLHKQRLGL